MNKEKMKKPFNKVKMLCTGASVAVVSGVMTPIVLAAGGSGDPGSVVTKLIEMICTIFRYIGILLLAWSVGMLVLAFKNEDADSKSRAMMLLVVSAALIGIKSFIDAVVPGV